MWMVNDLQFYNSVMEIFLHFHTLGSVAASSCSLCLDCAWFLYQVISCVDGRMLGGQANPWRTPSPELYLLLPLQPLALVCSLRVQGFSWPAASPSGQPSPLHSSLGMCSQSAHFPPAPGNTPLGAPRRSSCPCIPTPTPRRGLGAQASVTYLISASQTQLVQLCIFGSVNTLNMFV